MRQNRYCRSGIGICICINWLKLFSSERRPSNACVHVHVCHAAPSAGIHLRLLREAQLCHLLEGDREPSAAERWIMLHKRRHLSSFRWKESGSSIRVLLRYGAFHLFANVAGIINRGRGPRRVFLDPASYGLVVISIITALARPPQKLVDYSHACSLPHLLVRSVTYLFANAGNVNFPLRSSID